MNVIRSDKQPGFARGRGRGVFGRSSTYLQHSRLSVPAFGQPSTSGLQKSKLSVPAFGQPSTSGLQHSKISVPAFGQPSTSGLQQSRPLGLLHTTSTSTPHPALSSSTALHSSSSCAKAKGPLFKESSVSGRRPVPRSSSTSGPRHRSSDVLLRTPMSTTSNTTENDSCCIVALSEGRGHARGEVGIAALDIRRPHLTLCQISDSQSYVNTLTKINVFNPVEIMVPNTFYEGAQVSKLYTSVRDLYTTVTLTTVQRRHFSDLRGLQQIKHLCAPEYSSVEILILHKFYALSSAAALLKYIEFSQNVIFAPRSLKVEYQGSQNTTVIDMDTAYRMELVKCLRGGGARNSLFGVLNHCNTSGGARLLRANILQPPCLPAVIQSRQACVREIVENPELFIGMQSILSKFINVEHLLTLCMYVPQQETLRAAEVQINYTLLLKTTLELLPPLSMVLENAHSDFFCVVKENLNNGKFKLILEHINKIVHDDARATKSTAMSHFQRSFLVKPGINGLLDVASKTYCEIVEDIRVNVASLAEKYNLPLRLQRNGSRGFHIQLVGVKQKTPVGKLPQEFIKIQKVRNTLSFTTSELIFQDQRAKDALEELQVLSNVVVYKLLMDIREHISCLYKLCENIAELDVLVSLARISATPNYVRPNFGSVLDIKKSTHPMLDFISQTEPVANDIFASRDFNCQIITGPNMSGKSIYIRQVVLLQIMAQIGCYVPAEKATFRIADHIFSRIGFDDSIECNASTFVLELKELQYIKQTLSPNSMIIIDELCRGTSSEEGTAVAFAICEDLLQTDAFLFVTTHFLFLTKLQDMYCNVTNYYFDVVEEVTPAGRTSLKQTHRLQRGVTQVENYGLSIAEASAMPRSVVKHARELAQSIATKRKVSNIRESCNNKDREQYEVVSKLIQLHEAGELTLEKCKELTLQTDNMQDDNESNAHNNIQSKDHTTENENVDTGTEDDESMDESSDTVTESSRMNNDDHTNSSVCSPECAIASYPDQILFKTPGPVYPRTTSKKLQPYFSV